MRPAGRPALRRSARATALGAIGLSFAALVHDLGRPSRFHHMLRVAKPTSPMSVGTWILAGYGPMAGVAAVSELADRLPSALAPAVAAYTAVLLGDTATPNWSAPRRQLPYVFVGSSAAAAGGAAMMMEPTSEADVARVMAVAGAVTELAFTRHMESAAGLPGETFSAGVAGRYMTAAKLLTATGALLAAGLGGRSRAAAALAGSALLGGSACTRFGIFHAGQASARDPRYTVMPQRERLAGTGRPSSSQPD